MTKHFELADNATLAQWWWPKATDDLLFPEQEVEIGGVKKLRGGAHICCPIFGIVPKTKDYKGVELPQHGLVRTGDRGLHWERWYKDDGKQLVQFIYGHPWYHEVVVTVKPRNDGKTLEHEISVYQELNMGPQMPLSLGLHPYFPTRGGNFQITYGNRIINSDEIKLDEPFFIERFYNQSLYLEFDYGRVIEIVLEKGYDRFCIWTDAKDKYICVEPVLGGGGRYNILHEGDDPIRCICTLRAH